MLGDNKELLEHIEKKLFGNTNSVVFVDAVAQFQQ